MFPNSEIQKLYKKYKVNCYLDQNLTNTKRTSMFFVFICDLDSNIRENQARNIIFEVMIASKIFDKLILSAEFYNQFNCHNTLLKRQVGLFEIENIDQPNVTIIALNPKECYERFANHTNNKKHKGSKKKKKKKKNQPLIWILILIRIVYQI